MMIVDRIVITLGLALLAGAAYFLLTSVQRGRMKASVGAALSGGPQLLYFRGAMCATCTAQGYQLEQIAGQVPVPIQKIDVEEEPEMAARYGIFTLPTTVILDSQGTVKHINYGLADASKLSRQLRSLL